MPQYLMIRPVTDDVTEITYEEAQDVLDYFDEKGISYIDLAKDDATREKVEKVLKENPKISVLHYDHGNETSWIGQNGAVVDLENVELLKERECYCNNCSSAKKLGVKAWNQGAIYWGNKDVFIFTTDALKEFQIAVNYGIKKRVDGLSWKDCLEQTKAKMIELRDDLIKAGKALAAACMTRDHDILVCYNTEPPSSNCRVRRLAIRAFGPKIGWKLTWRFTISLALIVLLLFLACSFFYIGWLQADMMFWDVIPDAKQNEYWIPEFNITYRNAFIMFMLSIHAGFALVVILLVLCLSYAVYAHLKTP